GLIVALGGGVVGDLGGFAAASYMRGVDFIQIPTTLLAMVDSSVGGKTAINLAHNKNIMGAFHQPRLVCADLNFLTTLPERELMAGMMEIIKYGLILDEEFYRYIRQNRLAIRQRHPEVMAYLIYRSCQLKAQIVSMDETDQGIRNILNLGHTIGHALESYTDYLVYLHGEAIAVGTTVIMEYLHEQGIISDTIHQDFIDLLDDFSLPHTIPASIDVETLCNQLRYDKKNKKDKIQWVLLKKIGIAAWDQHLNLVRIEKILQRITQ
ncbi:MAG: 3-dehydroquinate synthase, partial [Candidatus Delongbacteria bacterium]|nr:3-dehydroquinate synthase [Candidatus Delongbacteria bacterium]